MGIDMRMADYALRIDKKYRARVDAAFLVKYSIRLANRAMGPVIGKQRKWKAAQLFRPHLQAWNGVGADLQNLDIERLELFVVLTEPGDLILSTTGECKWQISHNGAPAAKSA